MKRPPAIGAVWMHPRAATTKHHLARGTCLSALRKRYQRVPLRPRAHPSASAQRRPPQLHRRETPCTGMATVDVEPFPGVGVRAQRCRAAESGAVGSRDDALLCMASGFRRLLDGCLAITQRWSTSTCYSAAIIGVMLRRGRIVPRGYALTSLARALTTMHDRCFVLSEMLNVRRTKEPTDPATSTPNEKDS